jgi:hypothetical protein
VCDGRSEWGLADRGTAGGLMKKIIAGLAGVAAVALAAGCGSSSTSGTEHITGNLSTAQANASNPVVKLSFTGPVVTSGSTELGGNAPAYGQTHLFSTAAGHLVVQVTNHPNDNAPPQVNTASCFVRVPTVVDYKIDGSKSTGTWAKTSGDGVVTVAFEGTLPRLANGQCNMSNNVQPSNAHGAFTGVGPVTVSG